MRLAKMATAMVDRSFPRERPISTISIKEQTVNTDHPQVGGD